MKINQTLTRYLFFLTLTVFSISNTFASESLKINKTKQTIIAPEANSYTWYYNGQRLEGITGNKVTALKEGTYSVKMTTTDGVDIHQKIVYKAKADSKPVIYIIGDSTASIYDDDLYPRTGWGQIFQAFINSDSIEVVDMAISGRSSKSFFSDEKGWPVVRELLSEGDYLFIQFGHNDNKDTTDERYTDPYTTYQQYLSYYIDSARYYGATPVLLTSIPRNSWSGSSMSDTHGDYPPAMRALAKTKDVPLIDLTETVTDFLEGKGETWATSNFYNNLEADIWNNYTSGNEDDTHMQENGAYEVCKLVSEGIEELKDSVEITSISNALVEAGRLVVDPASYYIKGDITGYGVYTIDSVATLVAEPRSGYLFTSWTKEDSTLTETETYTIKIDTAYINLSANFASGSVVEVRQNPAFKGYIEGEGTYLAGTDVTITASPKDGYSFVCWIYNSDTVSTDTSYTFTIGETDVTYYANFKATTSSINNTPNNKLKIFPNPTSGNVTISSQNTITGIKLFNTTGQLLFKSSYSNKEIILNPTMFTDENLTIIQITTTEGQTIEKLSLW